MTPADEESKRPKTITFYPDSDVLQWWNSLAPQTGSRLINELIRTSISATPTIKLTPTVLSNLKDRFKETWGVAEPPIEQSATFMNHLEADGHEIFSASPVMRGAGSLKMVVVWKIKRQEAEI